MSVQHGSSGGPPPGEAPRWLDDKKNIDKIWYALCAVCALLVAADFLYHKHAHFPVEEFPGFHAAFGFAFFTLVVLSGAPLRRLLMRDEDYYDQ